MIERIFDIPGILTVAVIGLAASICAIIATVLGKDARKAAGKPEKSVLWSGIEAAILPLLGGFAARAFISVLLGSANDSPGASLTVGWAFFLIPGFVDTIAQLVGSQPILSTMNNLLLFAGIVGAGTGMMGGIYQIYDWEGLGWLAFPLDVTWALAGNTIGCLLHLINIGWGDHEEETRNNGHRYASGFRLQTDFAFTQGNVMSDCSKDLRTHEMTHVWQGRAFGPMFTLTYIGWMLVWLIPSMIAGLIVTKGPSGLVKGPMRWCYFNNPWEAWAYAVQGVADRKNIGKMDDNDDSRLTWRPLFVILWAIPFFLVSTALAVFVFYFFWLKPQPAPVPHKSNKPEQHRHAQIPKTGYLDTLQQAIDCSQKVHVPIRRAGAETNATDEYRI